MAKEKIRILLFYKYVKIDSPAKFSKEHLKFCNELGIRGRILVAKEGINGSVSGNTKQIKAYKKEMHSDKRFNDLVFKEDLGTNIPFKKMVVKPREQILKFDYDVNLKNAGRHLTPKEFLALYKNKEEVIIVDARNDYESRIGKFKNAIIPPLKTFNDFPKVAKLLKGKKDKKIVLYCTGGIRCEKASAYLKEQKFKDVSQLSGGILAFGKEFPDTVWEGSCFVFDKRMKSEINYKSNPLTKCDICKVDCDFYRNCRNVTCNELIIVCPNCNKDYCGCCSEKCLMQYRKSVRDKEKQAMVLVN
jgi:UPF0176 protein